MRIGDFADVRGGKRLPNGEPLLDHPTAHPYIRLVDVVDRRINNANVKYLSPEIHKQISSYIVSGHDVCLAIVGHTIGLVFYVDEKWHGANLTENAARITNIKGVDPRYLFYVLSSSYGLEDIKARTVGSAQGKLPLYSIRDIEVLIPSLLEQRAIAHILGTLDDKIELNRQMNETLEAMARALFKSWFVDFDPVRAKAEDRDHGRPKPLADLFPDSFENLEMGEIPKGWEVKPIGDFIERLTVGQKYEQKTVSPIGKVPVLDQGKSGVIGYHDDAPGVVASVDAPVVVFANHTCYMRLIAFSFSTIQNVLPFIGKGVDTVWAFYATYGKQSFIEYKGHWPDFVIHKIAVPDPKLTTEFARLAHPLLKQIWMRESESRTLAVLRDTLLPKLISGDLSVKDAERFIGRAT